MNGWYGVDFDGTLAKHLPNWPLLPPGPPITSMVKRVREWLDAGIEVRIFTARVSDPDRRSAARHKAAIEAWCLEHLGQKLEVTCKKDFSMVRLYDDRAVQVESNTGRLIEDPEGL